MGFLIGLLIGFACGIWFAFKFLRGIFQYFVKK